MKNEMVQSSLASPTLRWTHPTISAAALSSAPGRLPSDLQSWLDANTLVYLILEIQESLPWTEAMPLIEQPDGSRISPRMPLILLTYAYCRGFYSTQEIINECREDAMMRFLCAGQWPDAGVLQSFRRHHRELLRFSLARTLATAAKEYHRMRSGRGDVDRTLAAISTRFEAEADSRLRLAIQLDSIERDI